MSFEQIEDNDTRLMIRPAHTGIDRVWMAIKAPEQRRSGTFVDNADVPTVAAELLKAAGRDDLAELIESAAREAAEKAETEAAEKKLQERRDAVLAALLPEAAAANNLPEPHELSTLCDRAIDRIIELEDGASRD